MADDDGRADDQGPLRLRPDDRLGVDVLIAVERQPGELGPLDEDVVPGNDGLARAHRLDDRLAGQGHAVDIGHEGFELVGGAAEVLEAFPFPDGLGRGGRGRRELVLEPFEFGLGRAADGAGPIGEKVVEKDAFRLLDVDVMADAAAVLGHGRLRRGYLSATPEGCQNVRLKTRSRTGSLSMMSPVTRFCPSR